MYLFGHYDRIDLIFFGHLKNRSRYDRKNQRQTFKCPYQQHQGFPAGGGVAHVIFISSTSEKRVVCGISRLSLRLLIEPWVVDLGD